MLVDIKDEVDLWRAVLYRAFIDAKSNSQRKKDPMHRAEAIQWLDEACEDFVLVCELAKVDYKQLLDIWRKKC